jgi:1,4-alpha-glucan branching enzyme
LRVARDSARIDGKSTMNTSVTKQPQVFSLNAPGAHSVLLAGDFTRWLKRPIPLHKEANGVWRTTTSLAPGTYHYRFLVDGEWQDDPECKLRVQNPFGTQNDVIQVPAKPAPELQTAETTPAATS